MRRTRPQDRKRELEPGRCSCAHIADTPEWHGSRTSGAGLTGRHAANHGNVFTKKGGCIHSELRRTTRAVDKVLTVMRIRL